MKEDLTASIGDRRAKVDLEMPEGVQVLIDANDLRIVLQNLVSNAVKFADPDAPVVTVGAERRGGDWRISVRDNGAGIAPEQQERIFGAFERVGVSGAGYGLGLAICQRLVDRHGGQIGVESAPGQDTRFWFTLPAAAAEVRAAPEPEGLAEPA